VNSDKVYSLIESSAHIIFPSDLNEGRLPSTHSTNFELNVQFVAFQVNEFPKLSVQLAPMMDDFILANHLQKQSPLILNELSIGFLWERNH
jgi:hypothetical protein